MNILKITRRGILTLGAVLLGIALGAPAPSLANDPIPIVFVHGNGDTAGLWQVIMWRFESNSYPRNRLFAVDLANPTARTEDSIPEPGKSSTADVKNQLADFVARFGNSPARAKSRWSATRAAPTRSAIT
jgi:triacylglycerol esterase/lipase EstA (alpha/beta hydrolase family)